jgi:hypothetical protein
MNITDELRKWAEEFWEFAYSKFGDKAELLAIADRIDAEHERQLEVLYRDMSDAEYVELPKDADGEYIHVGDRMQVCKTGTVFDVTLLRLINSGWVVNPVNFVPSDLRHYHAPTVEDVLREFVTEFNRDDSELCDGEIIERFAAKLQLKEDE